MNTVAALEIDQAPALKTPFKGFEPYLEQDSAIFCGRKHETRVVLANLRSSRLTLLYGASGVGKTSLLRAGVVHELQARAHEDLAAGRDPEFAVAYFGEWSDWSFDPVAGVFEAIAGSVERLGAKRVRTLLLILDQFESYFVYYPRDTADDHFAAELSLAANQPGLPINILVSIREDALARLDRFKGRIPNLFENYLRIGHLQPEAANEAIVGPIDRYNASLSAGERRFAVEDELVEAVLDGVRTDRLAIGQSGRGVISDDDGVAMADAPIETAYLQLVMRKLWEEEKNDPARRLRKETLDRLGGPQTIALAHVRDTLDGLPADEQSIAAKIFDRLVTPSGTKIAQRDADLADWAGVPGDQLNPLFERLSAQDVRILRLVPAPEEAPAESRHELFHDVLVSGVLEWSGRHEERRRRDELEERDRRRRKAREKEQRARFVLRAAVALALGLVVVAAFAGWALYERAKANVRAQDASANARATQATALVDDDPAAALASAARAFSEAETNQTEDTLRLALATPIREVVATPPGGTVIAASFGRGGVLSRLLVTDHQSTRIWDTRAKRVVDELDRTTDSASFAADGSAVVFVDQGVVRRWPVGQASSMTRLLGKDAGRIETVSLSSDGRFLATTDEAGSVRVWDLVSKRRLFPRRGVVEGLSAGLARDGSRLVIADYGSASVWDVRTGEKLNVVRPRGSQPIAVAMSPNGRYIATVGQNDGTAGLWNATTGDRVYPFLGQFVQTIVFNPAGDTVATTGTDERVLLWSVEPTAPMAIQLPGDVVSVSRDGTLAVVTTPKETVLWDVAAGHKSRSLGRPVSVNDAPFSPEGAHVALVEDDGTTQVWDIRSGTRQALPGGVGTPMALGLGGRLAVVYDSNGLRVIDLDAKEDVTTLDKSSAGAFRAEFAADDEVILTVSPDAASLWSARDGRRLANFSARGDEFAFGTVSADSQHVVTTSKDGTILAWDRARPEEPLVLSRQGAGTPDGPGGRLVSSAAFDPSGAFVVAALKDGVVGVFGTLTGAPLASFTVGSLSRVAFGADAKVLVVAGDRMRIYDCGVCTSKEELKQLANDRLPDGLQE